MDDFSESFPFFETKEAQTSNDKRIYVNIKNVENKKLIGFKTNKIIIPFKIINTKFDESNTIFIYDDIETNKFTVKENQPFLFVLKIKENNNKLYSKFTSDININYFNSLKYYGTTNKFQSFSYYQNMNNLTENAYKIFIANNKTVVFKELSKSNYNDNYFGFLINQTIAGQIKFELVSRINEFSVGLNDDIPYNLKNGINYVTTNLNRYNGYFYILKHPNSEGTDMIDICASNGDFSKNQINMYNCDTDIKKDDLYTYYFSNFYSRTNLIIFSKISSDITIRQSNKIETDIVKIRNFNENVVQVKNTNKIVLISDINIDSSDNKYYFKYTVEKKYKDKVVAEYYLENKDIDNIIDFFERNKNNIVLTTALNYEDKIDYYLESHNSYAKSAVLMFKYYNGEHSLLIPFKASKNSFLSHHSLNQFQNSTFQINNKMFFIDLVLNESHYGEMIYIEFKGNKSTFNSTQVYIRAIIKYEYYSQTYNYFNNCTESEQEEEIVLLCNFTQQDIVDKYQFMLLLNEGKQIFIRSIRPEQSKNKDKINLIYYLGIPIIIIIVIIVISLIIFIIKRRKKNINAIEEISSGSLIKELNQASD